MIGITILGIFSSSGQHPTQALPGKDNIGWNSQFPKLKLLLFKAGGFVFVGIFLDGIGLVTYLPRVWVTGIGSFGVIAFWLGGRYFSGTFGGFEGGPLGFGVGFGGNEGVCGAGGGSVGWEVLGKLGLTGVTCGFCGPLVVGGGGEGGNGFILGKLPPWVFVGGNKLGILFVILFCWGEMSESNPRQPSGKK